MRAAEHEAARRKPLYDKEGHTSAAIPIPSLPPTMSDSSKQDRIEELLRKSLLGEELVDTQFHLYSARSSPSGRILKPRVLCANNVLLAKSSTYFLNRRCRLLDGRSWLMRVDSVELGRESVRSIVDRLDRRQ